MILQNKNYFLDFDLAIDAILSGSIIIYPTETFYALGCLFTNQQSMLDIYKIKKRDKKLLLPCIAADLKQISTIADISNLSDKLISFWPGPLSIVLPLLNSSNSIAIRIPNSYLAKNLAKYCGILVSTSANMSGNDAIIYHKDIDKNLLDEVISLGGGILRENISCHPIGGLASTIVELIEMDTIKILRKGAISVDQLKNSGLTIIS